ncbi:MAG TPA: efflux RND transporter permease subunit [Longimicrobiales bacterium]
MSKRKGLPSLSIVRPVGTVMLTLVLLVLGLFYLGGLPLDLLPSIVYPQLRASVTNPGVEPEVLEETIAKPLEAALSTTQDLERIETQIQEGQVGVNLYFAYGTNVDFALQDASKNLDRARSQMPEEANPPTIFKFDPSQSPIYEEAFSSSSRDLVSLRDWVEYRLRPQLLTIEGVASVDVSGGLIREIQVTLDQERLRSYGLTVSQVIDALRTANQDVAAGRITSPTRELVGKTAGKFRTVEDVENVLLTTPGRGRVPLTEVATVRDTHQDQRLWARLDGVPAVKLSIRKQPNANTVAVAEGIENKIEMLSNSAFIPADIEHRVLNNSAEFVKSSVGSVRDAALLGAGLAMIIVFLFLGSVRKTFVIGLAIPIAIMTTFLLMGASHLTLNMMSLGGLALGVGMLVDNSIVMLENIFRHKEEGNEDPEEAAHEGAGEVQSAIIAASLAHLSSVVPFLMISGLAALIFRELIITISMSTLASLLVALTLVPMMSAQFGKVKFTSGIDRTRFIRGFERGLEGLKSGYRRLAPNAIRYRWAVLAFAAIALVGSTRLTSNLGNEFLPQVDDGNVGVSISLPPGSPAEETNRVTLEIEAMVREMKGVKAVFATAGGQIFGNSVSNNAGRGSLDIVLDPPKERGFKATAFVAELQQKIDSRGFPGARISVRPPRIRGLRTSTSNADIALTIQGDDLSELRSISDDLMQRLRGVPGLENLTPSADEAAPQLSIELDRQRASYLGLNVAAVGQTLRTALDGTVATQFTAGNQQYDLRVRLPREQFTSPEDVGSVALFPGISGAAPIYLRDVANVRTTLGPTSMLRENQNRIFRVTGDVNDGMATVGEVNDSIRARLASLELPDGYALVYGGEEEAINESNRQLAVVVFLAIFLVFVVMAVQYESVVDPFVILFAIPLSLIGVCLALWITQTPLSAPVLLGVIMLAGIVVNNSILMVEYTEQLREEGMSRPEAAVTAGSVRLRPILMTTLTTICGMLPLALGLGDGAELMQPLAITVIGGLAVSTLLTLFVVPAAYVIVTTSAERLGHFVTGSKPQPAEVRAAPMREPAHAGDSRSV